MENPLYLALIHHPVLNKEQKIVTSSVTNLDMHDISRLAKTYNAKAFYVLHPMEEQRQLSKKIQRHWTQGYGKKANHSRSQALFLLHVLKNLEEALEDIEKKEKKKPLIIATSAKEHKKTCSFEKIKHLNKKKPYLLLFGTAWGLAEEIINKADFVLEPIKTKSTYNHLSVRLAAAIILDRLEKIL